MLFSAGYLTSIIFGAISGSGVLYIPVLGGLIHVTLYSAFAVDVVLGLAVSAAQITGVILFILGLVANIPDEAPTAASLTPRLVGGPGDAGAALRWSF